MTMINCRHFNGYKPCGKSEICDHLCPQLSVPSIHILLIHLEALGAVMRSTALLPAIRRKYPGCHITWVTQAPADQLLKNNNLVDRVLTTSSDDLLQLSALEFDIALVVDKSLKAAGVLNKTRVDQVYGFRVEGASGAIVPANPGAQELWEIGLSNAKKFFQNTKTEVRLAHEALELGPYRRDEYVLNLSLEERELAERRRASWARDGQLIVGINTGCASTIPAKKLSIERHREIVGVLNRDPMVRVVLLGGREDSMRNQRIAYGLDAVQSPTERGLRDGIASVEACDIVITGDSLGMHLAIALKKWTIAWFGPTCAHEIELYDRGFHVQTQASCSPCWKRTCDKNPMCYDMVSVDAVVASVYKAQQARQLEFINENSDSSRGIDWPKSMDLNT